MRVLHLIQPWEPTPARHIADLQRADAAVFACRNAVAAIADAHHTVLSFGGTSASNRAAALGLTADLRIAPPLSDPSLAGTAFKRIVRDLGPFDHIHAWGTHFSRLLRQLSGGPRLSITNLTTGDVHRSFGGTLGPQVGILHPPAADPRRVATWRRRRAALRALWEVPDDEIVLALVADPPPTGHAGQFLVLLALLEKCFLHCHAAMHESSFQIERVQETMWGSSASRPLIMLDVPTTSALGACDVALLAPPSRFEEPLPNASWAERSAVRVAMQLGVPVVSSLPGAIPDAVRETCEARRWHPADYAATLRPLMEDASLRAFAARACAQASAPDHENDSVLREAWGLASAHDRPASDPAPAADAAPIAAGDEA